MEKPRTRDPLRGFSKGASAKKITFGAKNKAKLTADRLETVSYKGWTQG